MLVLELLDEGPTASGAAHAGGRGTYMGGCHVHMEQYTVRAWPLSLVFILTTLNP